MSMLLALCLLAQDDKAAAELLKKLADRAATAKTLHVKAKLTSARKVQFSLEMKLKEPANLWFRATVDKRNEIELRSDGRRLVVKAPREQARSRDPQSVAAVLRRCVADSVLTPFFLLMMARHVEDWRDALPAVDAVKWKGVEKIGGVEASIVSYTLTFKEHGRTVEIPVKTWIDAAKLTVLKRELTIEQREEFAEEYETFAYDVDISDDDFAFQSAKTLAAGRVQQVAESVKLFVRFTGHVPRSLDELAKRPDWLDKDVFWPEGGFWLGGKVADVPYAVDGLVAKIGDRTVGPADRRAVVLAGERLSQYFSARVRVALIAAAVNGFRTAYGQLPRKKADLWQKPDWATVWPEGGFIAQAPVDPWGAPIRIVTDVASVRVMVTDWRERAIKLTEEERKALEAGGGVRLTAAETKEIESIAAALRDEDLETREKGAARLAAWGSTVAEVLDRFVRTEKDPEALARFKEMRAKLRTAPPPWTTELKPLNMLISGAEPAGPANVTASERVGSATLKTITTAQADFRANDRDNNLVNDFWVKDVAGLHALEVGGATIRLIERSAALADASPNRGQYPSIESEEPAPRAGYLFSVMESQDDGDGQKPYDEGGGRSRSRFGFVAYPAEYGVTGMKTFIVNADNTLWWKDTGGEAVKEFPLDPAADGWTKVD